MTSIIPGRGPGATAFLQPPHNTAVAVKADADGSEA